MEAEDQRCGNCGMTTPDIEWSSFVYCHRISKVDGKPICQLVPKNSTCVALTGIPVGPSQWVPKKG